jgi:hypothetical protein
MPRLVRIEPDEGYDVCRSCEEWALAEELHDGRCKPCAEAAEAGALAAIQRINQELSSLIGTIERMLEIK